MAPSPRPSSLGCVPSERGHVKRENAKPGARLAQLEIKAQKEAVVYPIANGGRAHDYEIGAMESARLLRQAQALDQPVSESGRLVIDAGEAVAVERDKCATENGGLALAYMVDTLETPAVIPIEASEQRMRGLADLGVLQSGLDAAKTAQARTSLEKMLCHQTAAAHLVALRVLARADDGEIPAVDVARLANTAARLMEVSQAAVVTLARARNMGRQVVEVQHVHQHVQVGEGGQAVVAGSLKGGRGSRNRVGRRSRK